MRTCAGVRSERHPSGARAERERPQSGTHERRPTGARPVSEWHGYTAGTLTIANTQEVTVSFLIVIPAV